MDKNCCMCSYCVDKQPGLDGTEIGHCIAFSPSVLPPPYPTVSSMSEVCSKYSERTDSNRHCQSDPLRKRKVKSHWPTFSW